AREFLKNPDADRNQLLTKLYELVNAFETLLADTKFMAKVSDRLQNKLTNANLELQETKQNLELKVEERTADLLKAYQQLMDSHEELETFVYRVSHDLRGPITRLTGLANVAMMDLSDEQALNYIRMFRETAELMDSITLRLIMVHQLKNAEVTTSDFPLSSVLTKVRKHLEHYPESLITEWKLIGDETMMIHADIEKWDILLTNLFENALQHVPSEEIEKPFIQLSIDKENDHIVLLLTRNGISFREKQRENLFNLFFRTSHHPKHTGIELYTAKIAAHKLSGTIEVVSSNEQQTTMKISVPSHSSKNSER
ncbi:MAG: HAMP domain-containing histidine kinase, partial [Flammeovirgaceae bacterium]|nr:HAMP domain-containing histidine kinase [Flammeovirgaceae bacterium]MDW8287726.1 HAMP domain-containing sensor histidine kinase [Flammeovirgaceae bacterium]